MLISVNENSGDSCSLSLNETVNGCLHFTVTNFSQLIGLGIGKSISSETFNVGGYDWAIYFYPDGKSKEDNGKYVSVFIALKGGRNVKALFELTMLDQGVKGRHKIHGHFDRAWKGEPYTLMYPGSMWGYKRYIKHATVKNSDYLRDDCLSFHGTVGVVKNGSEGLEQYNIPIPPLDVLEFFRLGRRDLQCLFESAIGCDMVIQVGHENFKAHKLILAARSPVFSDMVFAHVGDTNMFKVKLEEIEPLIFKAVLLFIYSEKLPNAEEYGCLTSTSKSTITLQNLLAASGRFGLYKLKQLCEKELCGQIDVETVATTLSLADQHRCSDLKKDCLKFAARHLGVVKQTEGFKYLENSCPSLLSEVMETVALLNDKESQTVGWKRSGNIEIDVAAEKLAAVDLGSSGGKRIRSSL